MGGYTLHIDEELAAKLRAVAGPSDEEMDRFALALLQAELSRSDEEQKSRHNMVVLTERRKRLIIKLVWASLGAYPLLLIVAYLNNRQQMPVFINISLVSTALTLAYLWAVANNKLKF